MKMAKNDLSFVNEKLRKERLERGWSQQYVADQLGIAVVTYNRWERGRQQPTAYYSLKLGTFFGKSAEELGLIDEKESALAADEVQQKTPVINTEPALIGKTEQHTLPRPVALPFDILLLHTSSPEQQSKVPTYFDLSKRGRILFPLVLLAFLVLGVLTILRYPSGVFSSSQANLQPQPSVMPVDLAHGEGKIALDDPLSGPRDDTQWAVGNNCSFKQSAYHMTSTIGVNYCLAAGQSFHNSVYQIEMVIEEGPEAGIVFHADDQSNLYYFSITPQGRYEVDLISPGPLKVLLHGTSSAIVAGYNHTNVLTVETNNAQLRFWINNYFVGQAHDATYMRGYIGIAVGDYRNPSDPTPMHAIFRNARVWLVS